MVSFGKAQQHVARRVLATWGNGDFGRLGHGLPLAAEELPRVVSGLAGEEIVAVACGGAHTAAVTGRKNAWFRHMPADLPKFEQRVSKQNQGSTTYTGILQVMVVVAPGLC